MTESAGAESNTMHMKYKIVFLGDQNVGKTSLILRFTQDTFDSSYQVYLSNFLYCLIRQLSELISSPRQCMWMIRWSASNSGTLQVKRGSAV